MELPPLGRRAPWREALGIVLVLALLAGGQILRRRLLLGPDGAWREDLWCAELLQEASPAVPEGAASLRAAAPAAPTPDRPLPLNTCSEDSLALLPGVGPRLAARLAASRDEAGPFRDAADLQRVKGIGPALAARIAPLVDFAAAPGAAPADRPKSP